MMRELKMRIDPAAPAPSVEALPNIPFAMSITRTPIRLSPSPIRRTVRRSVRSGEGVGTRL